MSVEFDFLTPTDKPALVGLTTPELQDTAKTALDQLGYKVHTAINHGEFLHKFAQVPYQVVVLEELFSSATPEENESLLTIQRMPMSMRRHAVFILFGFSMATTGGLGWGASPGGVSPRSHSLVDALAVAECPGSCHVTLPFKSKGAQNRPWWTPGSNTVGGVAVAGSSRLSGPTGSVTETLLLFS